MHAPTIYLVALAKKKKKVSSLRGRMESPPPLSPVDCNYYYYNKDGINDVSIVNDYRDYLLFDIYRWLSEIDSKGIVGGFEIPS